jgi:hypothetical protein
MTNVATSWLFIKRNETVRVFRRGPAWMQLDIAGPLGARSVLRFADEDELRAFQLEHEQQLYGDGWRLAGTNVERRSGADRRRVPRGADRRSNGAAGREES